MTRPLSLLRWHAHQDIDRKAGEVRALYISDPTGQQAVYQAKLGEAQTYLAAYALDENATPGPHIAAEATRRGMTAFALATEVSTLGGYWLGTASPAIEAERVGGKQDVTEATTEAEIADARAACLAALDAMTP